MAAKGMHLRIIMVTHVLSVLMTRDGLALERYVIGGVGGQPWAEAGTAYLLESESTEISPIHIAPDENIGPASYDLGGGSLNWGFGSTGEGDANDMAKDAMFDRSDTTAFVLFPSGVSGIFRSYRARLMLELGGRFPVNRVRFFTRPDFPFRAPDDFDLYVSPDQSEARLGPIDDLVWTQVAAEQENRNPEVEITFPAQWVRRVVLDVKYLDVPNTQVTQGRLPGEHNWEIAEFEVYGEGFVAEASYTSHIIDFVDPAIWGKLRWPGHRDPEAKVLVRTRTGTDATPDVFWRNTGVGDESEPADLTRAQYDRLSAADKGPITPDLEHWSFWSAPYEFEAGQEGTPVVSPGPRQYFQIKIDFLPTITAGARIDSLELEFDTVRAAKSVTAEIWPEKVEPAKVETFVYSVRPVIEEGDTGFDRLRIFTLVEAEGVRSVRLDGQEVDLDAFVPQIGADQLVVSFPKLEQRDTFALVEVEFEVAVVRYGMQFNGWVYDHEHVEQGGIPQLVEAGDATAAYAGNSLSVQTELGTSVIAAVKAGPNPFTPNGDGINDRLILSYSLLGLNQATPVTIQLFDLSGRRVSVLHRTQAVNGIYETIWDGTSDDGRLLPPGSYLYRLSVDTDEVEAVHTGAVSVVY